MVREVCEGVEGTGVRCGVIGEVGVSYPMVREVCEGVQGTGVRCGVIGEVGVSYPMTDFEKKSLQASTKAQHITGTYVHTYTYCMYMYNCKCTNMLVCTCVCALNPWKKGLEG